MAGETKHATPKRINDTKENQVRIGSMLK